MLHPSSAVRLSYLSPPFQIFGFERPKSIQTVYSLVAAILKGEQIPPIDVIRVGNKYYLLWSPYGGMIHGGHNRAIAYGLIQSYWRENHPMPVLIHQPDLFHREPPYPYPIPFEIPLVDDFLDFADRLRLWGIEEDPYVFLRQNVDYLKEIGFPIPPFLEEVCTKFSCHW